ncbi:hypothetical protein V5O48_006613 [Marasmius crinis-equi]|uniref:Enoyl reductase (ER) domain-containing protein n=1 Tax=Marasmius crinis-equi TaxID=585013 RepID=A0ABR3FJ06_9AGAR
MPPTTTITNLESVATRTRRSVTSNTSYDSASLDGHSLFSADDMMASKPIMITGTARTRGTGAGVERSSPKKAAVEKGTGKRTNGAERQRGSPNRMAERSDKRAPSDARVASGSSTSSKPTTATKTQTSLPQSSTTTNLYPSMRAPSSNSQGTHDSQRQRSKNIPKTKPNVMMSMAALLQQDEDAILHYSIPKSSVIIPSHRDRSISTPKGSTSDYSDTPRARQRANPGKSSLVRRRSRSLEDLPRLQVDTESSARSHSAASSPTSATSTTTPPTTFVPNSRTTTSSRPSSRSTSGYTPSPLSRTPHSRSTNAPDAFAKLDIGIGNDGQLHLSKNGTVQESMASVELTRGISQSAAAFTGVNGDAKGKGKAMESPFSITNSRKPPSYVPEGSVLVQVWAVGLDAVDARLCGVPVVQASSSEIPRKRAELGHAKRTQSETASTPARRPGGLIRTLSLSRKKTKEEAPVPIITSTSTGGAQGGGVKLKQPELGYTPGRSFVGRVVEVGAVEDEREMGFRKGDWIVGLLEVRRGGALQEFIVSDRRRIFRVPPPSLTTHVPPSSASNSSRNHQVYANNHPRSVASSTTSLPVKRPDSRLTVDELALLPLCGVQAYRAMRTLKTDVTPNHGKSKRILVLHGHDGIGAIAAQMLIKRGWKVVVHASGPEDQELVSQVTTWGGDAVVFDGGEGPVRMMERLAEKGDSLDAILDTIGGKEVWEAGARLLKSQVSKPPLESQPEPNPATPFPPPPPPASGAPLQSSKSLSRRFGSIRRRNTGSSTHSTSSMQTSNGGASAKQFITTVGDYPERPIPSASDYFKSGLRSMRKSGVDYTWVNVAQDIDYEGGDVRDALRKVLRMALEEGVRPACGGISSVGKVVSLEKTPDVLTPGSERGVEDGNTIVVRVVE